MEQHTTSEPGVSECGTMPDMADRPTKSKVWHLRVRPEQLSKWMEAAARDERDLADWVRLTLDRASRPTRGKATRRR
jgi:hypothetical protein